MKTKFCSFSIQFCNILGYYVYTYVVKIEFDDKLPEILEIVLGIKSYTSYPV